MNSTPTPTAIEPHNPLVVRADEQIARAYEQIGRADEQLARVTEQLAKMGAARPPSGVSSPQPPPSAPQSPPSAVPDLQPPPERPARRMLVSLLLLACVVVAALFLQSSSAKLIVAHWAPHFVSTSSSTPEDPLPVQRAASTVQTAVAEDAPPRATSLAQTAPQDATTTATAALPDQTPLPQTVALDLANTRRDIEQLKANLQQMAGDNSRAIEQLKASQEEMKRQLAMVSERNLPRTSPPPTQPTATSHKPKRRFYSTYERASPRMPSGWDYEEW